MAMKGSGKKQKSHPLRSLLLLTQPSVAILAMMVLLMQWRVPTPLRITLRTDLPQSAEFESLSVDMQSGRLPLARIRQFEIDYPDFPKMRPVTLTEPDRIELAPLGELHVADPDRDPERGEMLWRIEGSVSRFSIFSKGIHKDLRMTRFDLLLHSRPGLYALLASWFLFTAFGWFKLYQELRR
jgi:hypothetical protein